MDNSIDCFDEYVMFSKLVGKKVKLKKDWYLAEKHTRSFLQSGSTGVIDFVAPSDLQALAGLATAYIWMDENECCHGFSNEKFNEYFELIE